MAPIAATTWRVPHDDAMFGRQADRRDQGDFVATPRRLLETAARLGERPAYFMRGAHGWQATSWKAYGDQVNRAARALLALDVQAGQSVAILGFNRPEWAVMAFAAMMVGAIPVGIYWTSSTDDIEYILEHSGAPLLLVDSAERWAKVRPCLERVPQLKSIVTMPGDADGAPDTLPWADFMGLGEASWDAQRKLRLQSIQPGDTGSLIYTSGTTGPAKAVVLSHANLSWTASALCRSVGIHEGDRILSYLPFAHIAEQLGCLHAQALMGFTVYFARSMEELGEHLKEVRPTFFFGVPRVWEKMQAAIQGKLQQATPVKAALASWALGVGQRWHALDMAGRAPGAWLSYQRRLADRLVYRKVKLALGFDQARLLISGAAPIAPDNLRFFTGLDLPVRELYGQSETCGPSTISTVGCTRIGSVGKPFPGTELKVAPDGELLVRGPHVFQGYGASPQATAQALHDGWLHTGDLGHVDEDGYVFVTGRKKDLIITSGGKNISPGNIEAALMDIALVEHAVVCGDGRHFLAALLTLDGQVLAQFALQHGLPTNDLPDHPSVRAALQQAIDEVNTHQARVAHIRKFAVLAAPLTVEGGELTPTMKVKRKVVLDRQREAVEAFYQQ